jgi:hypothetical protein
MRRPSADAVAGEGKAREAPIPLVIDAIALHKRFVYLDTETRRFG